MSIINGIFIHKSVGKNSRINEAICGKQLTFSEVFWWKKKDVCYFIVLISKKHLGHRAEVIILVTFFQLYDFIKWYFTDWLEFKSVNQEKLSKWKKNVAKNVLQVQQTNFFSSRKKMWSQYTNLNFKKETKHINWKLLYMKWDKV